MSEDICLSNYSQTCEMISIMEDKENTNLISTTPMLTQIIKCFLNKLNDNDKQLAIQYLMRYFPNNQSLIQSKKELDGAKRFYYIFNYLNDYGLKKNQKIYLQNDNLNIIRLDENFHKLMELFEQKEFLENYKIPSLFHQQKHIIEKLKQHSFKLIDLIEQCQNSSFQLNSTILSHLVFFFFIPEELQINNREKFELYQLLGEIICQCWTQFEYHIQQLQFKEQNQNKLKILSEIPQLLFQNDLQILKDQMQQVLQMQLLNLKNKKSNSQLKSSNSLIQKFTQQYQNNYLIINQLLILKKFIIQFNKDYQSLLNCKLFSIRFAFIVWQILISIMKKI